MSARQSHADRFVAIELCAADREAAERAAAEAYAAGAVGLVEKGEAADGITFAVYAPAALAGRVRAALESQPVELRGSAAVPDVDWSERWKQDQAPIVVSPRLLLRPSFDTTPAAPGQRVIVIDPAQAFGTGAHESTRLALDCLDAIAAELSPETRLLDVGTGTGVLALAALCLGCARVCGLDADPLAGEAARTNAVRNDLSHALDLFVGTPASLAPHARFDVVVANLLLAEVSPLIPALAAQTAEGGAWVVSGLLESQRADFEAAAGRFELRSTLTRERVDASGAVWTGLVMRRASARSSRGTGAPA
jgi:ribosomal protein L11 methyltransferase